MNVSEAHSGYIQTTHQLNFKLQGNFLFYTFRVSPSLSLYLCLVPFHSSQHKTIYLIHQMLAVYSAFRLGSSAIHFRLYQSFARFVDSLDRFENLQNY